LKGAKISYLIGPDTGRVLLTWYLAFPIPLTMQIENFLPFGLPNQYQR